MTNQVQLVERSMRTRTVGWLAVTTLALTSSWLVLPISDQAAPGSLVTTEQVLEHIREPDAAYFAIYTVAGFLIVSTTRLFAGLYGLFRQIAPLAALCGVIVELVYTSVNLLVYFSRITIVPALIAQQELVHSPMLVMPLYQLVHQAPNPSAAFVNGLAYAVLGIPSILFGRILWRLGRHTGQVLQVSAGLLLALSGVLTMAGFTAPFFESVLLDMGLVAGGAVFWIALIPLSLSLLASDKQYLDGQDPLP
jgi:hypothetical protein